MFAKVTTGYIEGVVGMANDKNTHIWENKERFGLKVFLRMNLHAAVTLNLVICFPVSFVINLKKYRMFNPVYFYSWAFNQEPRH